MTIHSLLLNSVRAALFIFFFAFGPYMQFVAAQGRDPAALFRARNGHLADLQRRLLGPPLQHP